MISINVDEESVLECGCGCFLNAFHSEMYQNNIYFLFFKLFLISTHQNNLKTLKKY